MTSFMNQVALITGCGNPNGIGFNTAKCLLSSGCKVIITSTTERIFDRVKELNNEFAGNISHLFITHFFNFLLI